MPDTLRPIECRVSVWLGLRLLAQFSVPWPDAVAESRWSPFWIDAMTTQIELIHGMTIFTEIKEFAGFSIESQRYIRRSLDIGSGDVRAIERWSECPQERSEVRAQEQIYRQLDLLRAILRQAPANVRQSEFLTPLIELSTFDLDSGELDGFASYRFLYERLLGSRARPWLPSAFCAVALMPQVKPVRRIGLLSTLGDAVVATWSACEPSFYPEQIDA